MITTRVCLPNVGHDWLLIFGDIGKAVMATSSLGQDQKATLFDFMDWTRAIIARSHTAESLALLETQIHKILTKVEMYFPSRVNTICVHLLHHLPHLVREIGPVVSFWCYSSERYMGQLVKLAKSPKGIEVRHQCSRDVSTLITFAL